MGAREKWIMAAVVAAIVLYAFGTKGLLLCGVAALVYVIARPGRSHRT